MKNIGERAKKARIDAKLTQEEAAKKIGIKQPSLSDIENGKTQNISAKTLIGMANAYGKKVEFFETGIDVNNLNEQSGDYNVQRVRNHGEVPLISMVQAGDWTEAFDPYPIGQGETTLLCPVNHSESTFAVRVKGDSMLPNFPEGLILFIDPQVMPNNKDYCIAKLDDTNEATFKQYIEEDGQKFLKAINPDWPTKYIAINGNCHIVGKMIGAFKEY
jgi:SOS-response transcriptional repressor LexA